MRSRNQKVEIYIRFIEISVRCISKQSFAIEIVQLEAKINYGMHISSNYENKKEISMNIFSKVIANSYFLER